MKKIFSTLFMVLAAATMMAQQPVITFEKTEHDFGKIHEEDGRVSVVFEFKNEGMAPLVLSNVRASCGCTTPTWTKEPVEPGQNGSITVTYNPSGRPGRFQKTVTITSNASEATKKVYIKGEVIPKQAKPVNRYTVPVGALSMKTRILDLGTIKKGETKSGELEYTNLNAEEHTADLYLVPGETFLISQTTLPVVKKEEVGKFIFAIDSKQAKVYGPVEANAYVVIDGKADSRDELRLTIKADIVEDFSQMTAEDKQQAPIIEVAEELQLGHVPAGKNIRGHFDIKNIGVNPLMIRRAYCSDDRVFIKEIRPIKSGKKATAMVEIRTKGMEPGQYTRELLIISNDYANTTKRIKMHFTVE